VKVGWPAAVLLGSGAPYLALAALAVGVALGFGVHRNGSLSAAIDEIRGRTLHFPSQRIDLGVLNPGERLTVPVPVRNLSAQAVRIVGGHTTCSCTLYEDQLPLSIAGRSIRVLNLSIRVPSGEPTFRQRAVLYTEAPGQRRVSIDLVGDVREPHSRP
jgi:hypothetical protein